MPGSRLTRSDSDKILAGVCGGLAAYLGVDSVFIRLAFLILVFASGIGLPIYLILWVIMPRETTTDKTNSEVIYDNIDEMSNTVYSSVNRVGRPGTIGALLVLGGLYFLFNQFGWFAGINGSIFWPLVLVGLGVYMLIRRKE